MPTVVPATKSWFDTLLPFITLFVGFMFNYVLKYMQRRHARARIETVGSEIGEQQPSKAPGTGGHLFDSVFVRVRVVNRNPSTAKDCRAYLIGIQEKAVTGYRPADFYPDAMRLRWAYEGEDPPHHQGIDMPNHVPFHFDVFSTKNEGIDTPGCGEEMRLVQVANKEARYNSLRNKLDFNKSYRFEVMVVAENADPLTIWVEARLGQKWNDVEVLSLSHTR